MLSWGAEGPMGTAGLAGCVREGLEERTGAPAGASLPDQWGSSVSRRARFWVARSPVPRLIVSWIDGTGSMPTGCEAGILERDCAHPDIASPSIPANKVRFMIENLSILGECPRHEAG